MAKCIVIDGKEYPMRFPISAQEEVLKVLGMKSFTEFSDEGRTAEAFGSPITLGKIAYIGCKCAARRDKVEFPFTEEEFCDSVTSATVAVEQLMVDLGFAEAAAEKK